MLSALNRRRDSPKGKGGMYGDFRLGKAREVSWSGKEEKASALKAPAR